MDILLQAVAIDAADLPAVSSFWAGVLGGSVDAEGDWHMVMDRDGIPRIGIQLAPNHVPPQWPDGEPQQQIHLDLWVSDLQVAHDEVMGSARRCSRKRRTRLPMRCSRATPILRAIRSASVGTAYSPGRPHRPPLTQVKPGRPHGHGLE